MPTYISLIKYTHQGIATLKEGPDRLDARGRPGAAPRAPGAVQPHAG